jgi:hypothetical protein
MCAMARNTLLFLVKCWIEFYFCNQSINKYFSYILFLYAYLNSIFHRKFMSRFFQMIFMHMSKVLKVHIVTFKLARIRVICHIHTKATLMYCTSMYAFESRYWAFVYFDERVWFFCTSMYRFEFFFFHTKATYNTWEVHHMSHSYKSDIIVSTLLKLMSLLCDKFEIDKFVSLWCKFVLFCDSINRKFTSTNCRDDVQQVFNL